MKVYKLQGEFLGENTYLLVKEDACLVIDPGASAERINAACRTLGASIVGVLLTHAHVDHIIGAADLSSEGYPLYLHETDVEILNSRANLALALGLSLKRTEEFLAVKDGQILTVEPFSVQVIHTPGHTAGSVCYLIENMLFSGDTLFYHSYGRTDFPTGDEQDLVCSICNELFELPLDTLVYSGHSFFEKGETAVMPATPDTTIGEERANNPILELI